MAAENERDASLNKEKSIIKDLLLSRINNDGYKGIYETYLRQTMDVTNALAKEYFDSEDAKEFDYMLTPESKAPVKDAMNNSFFEKCYDYMQLFELNKDLGENYSVDKDIDYRRKKMTFVIDYNISKRLLEMIDWYFGVVGDTTHNKEQFVDMVVLDTERVFALRNELTGRSLDFSFDKEELNIRNFRAFLIAMLKIRLCGNYTMVNIEMGKQTDEAKGQKDTMSGALLFQLLNTATFISLAKEYGYTTEDLKLDSLIDAVRKAVMYFPDAQGFVESVSEVDNLVENADSLANRFLTQKLK